MFRLFSKNINQSNGISPKRKRELLELCKKMNMKIKALYLLDRALTHTSSIDKKDPENNKSYERLEFLGDSVLNLAVSLILFTENPSFMEGKLSSLRSSVVDEKTLSEIGISYNIEKYLNLGKGEKLQDERAREKVTADVVESIIAVYFLDNGFDKTVLFVEHLIKDHVNIRMIHGSRDYKTKLQKISIDKFKEYPQYTVIGESGPDHNKIFEMEVRLKNKLSATASGRSKKEAEQKAAEKILQVLKSHKLD